MMDQGGLSSSSRSDDRKKQDISEPGGLPLPVVVFLFGLLTPLFLYVGTIRLSVYRIVLLLLFFPSLYVFLTGKVGRVRLPDICVLLICIWSTLSFTIVHGFSLMIETIGILWVETLGAYMVGRCFIRTPKAFYSMVWLLFWLGVLLLPFAVYEMITDKNLILDAFDAAGNTYADVPKEKRMGLDRVQGPFAHQIHMGVFFGALVGLTHYVLGYQRRWIGRLSRDAVIAFLGFSSLSSGPLVAMMAQIYVLVWDGIMGAVKQRWHILAGLAALGYVVVDAISHRTPFHVVISYLAFNESTAYNRINIWNYGTASIFQNPLFGIGLSEDWARPWWMSPSVDMFWILGGMMHGIVVWIAYLLMFFSAFLAIAYRRGLSERVGSYRTGYLVTMFGLFMAGWTVHYWDALFVFFMFLLASGMWILDYQEGETDEGNEGEAEAPETAGRSRYSRFPVTSGRIVSRRQPAASRNP